MTSPESSKRPTSTDEETRRAVALIEAEARAKKFMRLIHALGFVWAAAAVASFLAGDLTPLAQKCIVVAWLLVPPIYFFFELHWVRKHLPTELENCKMSQQAAAKIWAGVSAALGLMYLGTHVA